MFDMMQSKSKTAVETAVSSCSTRRDFITALGSAAAATALGAPGQKRKKMVWAMYMQLGSNMWKEPKPLDENGRFCGDRCWADDVAWDNRIAYAKEKGINLIVVELAEALHYPSHP
jgi:hypothetical protein